MNKTIFNVEQIQDATYVAVDRLVNHGESYVKFSLRDEELLSSIGREAIDRSTVYNGIGLFREHGVRDGWENVSRATFFSASHLRHATNKQRSAAMIFNSRIWVPGIRRTAKMTAESLKESGARSGLVSLSSWRPNRIGINRMDGSPYRKAIIREHVDVASEIGAVVVFDLSRRCLYEYEQNQDPNLSVIFSKNTCDEIGIEQEPHSAESVRLRYSVTFAELNPGLASA